MSECPYVTTRMRTLLEYCKALCSLDSRSTGGMLHILLDDDKVDDESVICCLKEFLLHPEREESNLGIIICHEYLKMSIKERIMFNELWNGWPGECTEYIAVYQCFDCVFKHKEE